MKPVPKDNEVLVRIRATTVAQPPPPAWEPTLFREPSASADRVSVDGHSSAEAKIALFRSLFAGRDDVHAARWENERSRKSVGRGVDGADVPGGGTRESVWIGPARHHALNGAGRVARFLFGRLGHAHGAGGPVGATSRRTRTFQREKVRCVVPLDATSDVTL